MSLFPSFADEILSKEIAQNSWLENSSFQIEFVKTADTLNSFDSSNSEIKNEDKSCSIIKKRAGGLPEKHQISLENYVFLIDEKSTIEFLTVKTISRPSVAKYKIRYILNGTIAKNASFKRYFNKVMLKPSSLFKEANYRKISGSPSSSFVRSAFDSCKEQEELIDSTAFYNKLLSNEPRNVEMWLNFIDFQDTIFKSRRTIKKGSFAKALRTSAEHKINILEKALFHNPNSENLHRKRLQIMVSVYPADELQKHLKQLLEKDSGNIILWQGYIEATQCSMSHCNTLSVLNLYITCLSSLHKLKKNTYSDSVMLEESILRMLYQCGLFLKQSGLFERLWTLLKMYLEINLGELIQNSFNISTTLNEKQVLELEDMILKSQLPHHELWVRIEQLRELCHWLPVIGDSPDPQRIIFANDVFELIQPITSPENKFRLIVITLTSLKIPIIPCRHNTMQEFGLDYVPWAFDSIETILPIFHEIYPINLNLESTLIDFQLVGGPQYMKVLPGQEEYMHFILNIMQRCIDSLVGKAKYSLIIWWLRFQRLLIILNNTGRIKIPDNIKKSIKSNVKNLLRKPENRNNAILYIEYALLEREMTSDSSCIQILQIALSSIEYQNSAVTQCKEDQGTKCYLIRTIVETLIHMKEVENAQKYLMNFVLSNSLDLDCELNDTTIKQASIKFEEFTTQFLKQIELGKLPLVEHFLPLYFCDWISCNAWFIYFTRGPLECGKFLERMLEELNSRTTQKVVHKEIIYEIFVAIIFKFSIDNPGFALFKTMDVVLYRALQDYPNNLFLLSVMAKRQNMMKSLGPKWWEIKKLLLYSGHALPVLLLISSTYQLMISCQEQFIDLLTGTLIDSEYNSLKFKMLSLFKEATKPDMSTRRCGLVWRLYLQFVKKYFDTKLCRNIYYSAVEECPWLKAIYIDTALYLPAELGQVQDLLIEKQLRIHITPDELDILRD